MLDEGGPTIGRARGSSRGRDRLSVSRCSASTYSETVARCLDPRIELRRWASRACAVRRDRGAPSRRVFACRARGCRRRRAHDQRPAAPAASSATRRSHDSRISTRGRVRTPTHSRSSSSCCRGSFDYDAQGVCSRPTSRERWEVSPDARRTLSSSAAACACTMGASSRRTTSSARRSAPSTTPRPAHRHVLLFD